MGVPRNSLESRAEIANDHSSLQNRCQLQSRYKQTDFPLVSTQHCCEKVL